MTRDWSGLEADVSGDLPGEASPLMVFLCHAAQDKPTVRILYQRLRDDGFNPWLDEENLLPGQDWRLEIERAVHRSDCMIVCLSRAAMRPDGFMHREIALALEAIARSPERPPAIIPLRLEECDVPEVLAHLHWADYFDETGYRRLVAGLRATRRS